MSERSASREGVSRRRGFSLVELAVVLVIAGIFLAFTGIMMTSYFQRSSAKRAAQVFAQDLKLARSSAVRSRGTVSIRFNETSRWYRIVSVSSGTEVVRRTFGVDGDIQLRTIDLRFSGDSMVFNARGVIGVTGAQAGTTCTTTLGEASFGTGPSTYVVCFNRMGGSKVQER